MRCRKLRMTRAQPGLKRDVEHEIGDFEAANPLTLWVSWCFFTRGKRVKIGYRASVSEGVHRLSMTRDAMAGGRS